MKGVELYAQVRYAVQIEGLSRREAARRYGIDPRTVAKMLAFSVPPGYRRSRPPARPKLDPFTGIIDQILEDDKARPKKQRHTSKRIFERLRDEHGYAGGITIVKDYVLSRRLRQREVFVPLRHDPGHAQVDFGEALAEIAGVERKIHFFAMDLPHSDACFVQAYPAETAEAFCDGHMRRSVSSARCRARSFTTTPPWRWRASWATGCASGRACSASCNRITCLPTGSAGPARATTKAKLRVWSAGPAGTCWCRCRGRRASTALNEQLLEGCRRRLGDRLRGHEETIGERLVRDLAVFHALPASPYDACEKKAGRVSSLSLVRYRGTDYSVPTAYGHREVLIRGYVHEVVISCGAEVIARHPRSYEREDFVFDPLHYLALPSLNKTWSWSSPAGVHARRENVIAVGNSGTGKTHIALGLGLAACQKGLSVGFTTAAALVHELIEARDDKRLLRLQRQLAAYKLLIIDELGYVPLSTTGAELLFEVFSQRYERGSTIVTSNLPFDEWTGVFGSERLTGALLDRLTHHVHILEMNGDSYRLKQSKRRQRGARATNIPDSPPEE